MLDMTRRITAMVMANHDLVRQCMCSSSMTCPCQDPTTVPPVYYSEENGSGRPTGRHDYFYKILLK